MVESGSDNNKQKEESRLKPLQVIEDTINGIFSFVEEYLKTTLILIFTPWKIYSLLIRSTESTKAIRPLTYLTVSILITSVLISNSKILLGFGEYAYIDAYNLRKDIEGISINKILIISMPALLVIYFVALIYSWFLHVRTKISRFEYSSQHYEGLKPS